MQLDVALLINGGHRLPTQQPVHATAESASSEIKEALAESGANVTVITATDYIAAVRQIRACSPDVIFNLARQYNGQTCRLSQFAAVLNLLNIPCVGAAPRGLLQTCDKILAKTLVGLTGTQVPQFVAAEGDDPLVDGKRVSVCMAGNWPIHVFPVGEPVTLGTEAAPRQDGCRRGKSTVFSLRWRRSRLSAGTLRRLRETAKRVFVELQLRDCARVDFCLTASDELYFLDASDCPDWTSSGFGAFAAWESMSFSQLVRAVIAAAIIRHRRETGTLRRSTAVKLPVMVAGLGGARALIARSLQ